MHHGIWRMLTLTFAAKTELEDREAVRLQVKRFLAGLRQKFPGIAYIYVLELHPGGHGYHAHIGVNRFVDKRLLQAEWSHGWSDVRSLASKKRTGSRDDARGAARYLAKYAVKAEDEGRLAGKHRYERSQSGRIPETVIECDSWQAAVQWVRDHCKTLDPWEWCSDDAEGDWLGPRCRIFRE